MPISLRAAAALLVVWSTVSVAYGASERELVDGRGILARKDAVVLFAGVSHCATVSDPRVPAAQIFVSTDGGKTWSKKGPALEGNQFRYAYDTSAGLWVAGLHTLEDGADPFVLAPGKEPYQWDLRPIYDGASDLGLVAFRKDGELLAWVHHHDLVNDKWQTYLHASADGGRSWRTVGHAKRAHEKGLREFAEIRKRTPQWRIVSHDDGGFAVEHRRGAQAPRRTVSEFPVQGCDP